MRAERSPARIDKKALLWVAFFLIIVLALIDILRPNSVLVDFFSGTRTPESRMQRAIDRVVR